MIRSVFAATALLLTSLATGAFAQSGGQRPNLQIQSGFQSQNAQVQAVGEHDVAASATLRARGCQGYVTSDPSLSIVYNDQGGGGALVIRAESPTDLVLLIGTSTGAWFCNNDAVGTNPEITLPPGSGSYSVWVGTAQQGSASANVVIREVAASRPTAASGPCGSPDARIPASVSASDWTQYSCMSQEAAGSSWGSCHGRASYSDSPRDGCPGAELCCPGAATTASAPATATTTSSATTSTAAARSAATTPSAQPTSATLCGSPEARIPMSMAREDWEQFSCLTQAEAGARWNSCYGRPTYADMPSGGCPGAALCCPAPGFSLAASQQRARTAASRPAATTTASTTTATSTSTATTSTTTSAAAASGPQSVEANPFGVRAGALTIFWRGFDSAKLPVYAEPRDGAARVFELDAANFPVVVRDSIITATTPRRLRARANVSLSSVDGAIQVNAGQELELLALAGEGTCHVRFAGALKVAQCPTAQQFEGVSENFFGLSPSDYEWWVAVESPSRQRGWVRIDTRRPEFAITLPPR